MRPLPPPLYPSPKCSTLLNVKRRTFVTSLAAGAVLAPSRVLGAGDRVRIGLIGTGGRCMGLAGILKNQPNAEIVAACDVYEPRRTAAAERFGAQAKPVADYREILGRADIDAVVIAAPDHWHVKMTLDAVAASKDVYVEKPVTHEISEGERLIAGVERSKRVVATGTQQRSWEHYILAKQVIESGRLGQIPLVECYWYQNYLRRARPDPEIDSSKLDWKQWLGSARDQPFDSLRYLRWRFFWDFGGGIFTDLMTHWIDAIQWIMKSPSPKSITAAGATHALKKWFVRKIRGLARAQAISQVSDKGRVLGHGRSGSHTIF